MIITENVFGLPGSGAPPSVAIAQQDQPVIIGIVLLALGRASSSRTSLVDLGYAVLDPRVRLT